MTDTPSPTPERRLRVPASMRSIEAAAIAGLLHSALSLAATAMLLGSPEPTAGDAAVTSWYLDEANQRRVILAVNLLTVSSIMFLWFVAVIRRRVGERENRFFGTVFLGSALLLVGAWLSAGVLFAAPAIAGQRYGLVPDADAVGMIQAGGITMGSVVATRLEAVFIISTTTVGRLSGVFPRWLIVTSYTIGLALLLMPLPSALFTWVFPFWVAAMSLTLLWRRTVVDESLQPATS